MSGYITRRKCPYTPPVKQQQPRQAITRISIPRNNSGTAVFMVLVVSALFLVLYILASTDILPAEMVQNSSIRHKPTAKYDFSDSIMIYHRNQSNKLRSFHFVHVPKTGTSIIITLRNYLDSCILKNFTCNGVYGGGVWKDSKTNKENPYFSTNVSLTEELCNNTLLACVNDTYHQPYTNTYEKNALVMIRRPIELAISWMHWFQTNGEEKHKELTQSAEIFCEYYNNYQLRFVLNKIDPDHNETWRIDKTQIINNDDVINAINIVLRNMTFFGITNYWGLSLCLFHCEIGGTFTSYECVNTRNLYSMNSSHVPDNVGIQKLSTCFQFDIIYYNIMKDIFFQRVKKCNCYDLCL